MLENKFKTKLLGKIKYLVKFQFLKNKNKALPPKFYQYLLRS